MDSLPLFLFCHQLNISPLALARDDDGYSILFKPRRLPGCPPFLRAAHTRAGVPGITSGCRMLLPNAIIRTLEDILLFVNAIAATSGPWFGMKEVDTVKGFRDFLSEEAQKRNAIKKIVEKWFKLYGFFPLETPIACLLAQYAAIFSSNSATEGPRAKD